MPSAQPTLTSAATSARKDFLAKLKPVCVAISRLSMTRDQASPTGISQLITLTSDLYSVLDAQVKRDEHVITANDAEYVFVPLSYVFQRREAYPARLLENAVRCLRLLIRHGWRTSIAAELARQLLILLTFLVGGVPGANRNGKDGKKQPASAAQLPEETVLESFRTLTALFEITGSIHASASPFVDAAAVPTLVHTVSVVLDGVTEGTTPGIQIEALEAVKQIYSTIRDQEALVSFLPGTVSSLSKILSPPESARSQRRVLIKCLDVLKRVILGCLADMKVRSLLKQIEIAEQKTASGSEDKKDEVQQATGSRDSEKALTTAWLKATTTQLKKFLATVLKLRNHDADDVLEAVGNFCVALLDECHRSLANCAAMLVETALITLDPGTGSFDENMARTFDMNPRNSQTTLQVLAMSFPELGDTIKSIVYNWVTSLPRAMQSSDEDVKHRAVRNLMKGAQTLKNLNLDSTTIQDSVAMSLRDSVVALTTGAKPPKVINETGLEDSLSGSDALVMSDPHHQRYQPIMLAQESQRKTRDELLALISNIGSQNQQAKWAAEMLSYVQDSDGVDQVSAYWLSFQLIKAAYAKTTEEDVFLDMSTVTASTDDLDAIFREFYAFSVSKLTSHSDAVESESDWMLEAIALEVAAFTASREREAFRPELIDVLYPIATFLGSQHPQLRSHAVVTLNSIAAYCGYGSVSELIINNVDYLVNSVSLRLTSFDISPASTKVLTMMIHLTGPKLLPYLEDAVAAIFAALDNYHGYPIFVESLFAVLSEVVAQGTKSDVLLLEDSKSKQSSHRAKARTAVTTEDVINMLDKHAEKRKRTQEEEDVEEIPRSHPKKPWKSEAKDLLDKLEAQNKPKDENSQDEDREDEPPPSDEIERTSVPKTPTYALLARITTLTQHYLTSPAPTLRKSLLDILATVAPALAPDEDAFLPLVNAIWPVLVARLYDSEPYVSVAATQALGALCASAGDFLSSRFKTEWSDGLERWCRRAKTAAAGGPASKARGVSSVGPMRSDYTGPSVSEGIVIPVRSAGGDMVALQPSSSSAGPVGGLGRHAQAARVWEAAADMLAQMVLCTRVDDAIFDAILELLLEDGGGFAKEEHQEALQAVNADAVWLALYRRGRVQRIETPVLEGVKFAEMLVEVNG